MFIFITIMKSQLLLTFTILLNIVFVKVSLAHRFDKLPFISDEQVSSEALNFEETESGTDKYDANNSEEYMTTEDPNNEYVTTNEPNNNIETATKNDVRYCPDDQSSFTKQDLIMIINYFSDVQFNVLQNISDSYNDTAIQARDVLLKEFSEFKTKFEDRPTHLIHVLEDMENTRQKNIVPLVRTATNTLQEFPSVEDDFYKLSNKTMKMLKDLEKYKRLCELNNCEPQRIRSSFVSRSNSEDDNNMCSTIETVHSVIIKRLVSFEQEEVEKLKKYITDNEEALEKAITILKVRLREAAVAEFGVTMYEVLALHDDHFHFMNSLLDFNNKSHISELKKKTVEMEYKLLDLETKIQQYRRQCLTCGQGQRRRRFAESDREVENAEIVSDTNKTTILDRLLNEKVDELKKKVQAHIENIFKELNDTLNDSEFVEKTVAQLKPIQESVSNRTVAEKEALEALMKSVPEQSRERAQEVQLEAAKVIDTIYKTLAFFPKKNKN